MHRLWELTPSALRAGVLATFLLCGTAVVGFVAIRVLSGGWLLGIGILAAVAFWELRWGQPRRQRQREAMVRAMIEARQPPPGTQPLRSEKGKRHWTEALPRPLALVVTGAPTTLLVIATFIITIFVMDAFAGVDLTVE